jgi:hypothetical protein
LSEFNILGWIYIVNFYGLDLIRTKILV